MILRDTDEIEKRIKEDYDHYGAVANETALHILDIIHQEPKVTSPITMITQDTNLERVLYSYPLSYPAWRLVTGVRDSDLAKSENLKSYADYVKVIDCRASEECLSLAIREVFNALK